MTALIVMAKAPVPGMVKTRLCPPCTPTSAAHLAAAALADTLAVAATTDATPILAVAGPFTAPAGWRVVPQRGEGLGERLAQAFLDVDSPALLIGMDTPQVTSALLAAALRALAGTDADAEAGSESGCDAVLGLADDGGWWALGLRDPAHADVLRAVPMSTSETGARTLDALRDKGLRVSLLPRLRDVDTADDAYAVAALCPPDSQFARAVTRWMPA